MDADTIISLVTQLGISMIFVFLYFREKDDNRKNTVAKDERIDGLMEKILVIQQKSLLATASMEHALNNNTQVMKDMSDRVTQLLLVAMRGMESKNCEACGTGDGVIT